MLYQRKGSKKWWTMFRDPKRKGKYLRKSTGTEDWSKAKQIEQAEALAIKGKVDIRTMEGILRAIYGIEGTVRGMRFDEIWDNYRRVLKQRGSEQKSTTVTQIKKNVDDVIEWAVEKQGLKTVRELTSMLAIEYADVLKKAKSPKTGKPLKDKSRKNYIGNLSSVWAVLSGIEPEIGNPWSRLQPAVKDAQRHGAFTVEQESAILKAARASEDPTWAVLCVIARHTGLRKGDIVHLRIGKIGGALDTKDMKFGIVDMEARKIKTPPSKTEQYGILVETPMVKVLEDELLQWIGGLKNKGEGSKLFPEFVKTYPNDPVVTFAQILKAAGIKDETLTFHSYRHTFRTRLAEAGVSDEMAKKLGGWTQDKTLARYDHADRSEEIRAMIERAAEKK